MIMSKQLTQMYKLAVYDRRGFLWMPIYGQLLHQQIVAYAPALEAIESWQHTWLEDQT